MPAIPHLFFGFSGRNPCGVSDSRVIDMAEKRGGTGEKFGRPWPSPGPRRVNLGRPPIFSSIFAQNRAVSPYGMQRVEPAGAWRSDNSGAGDLRRTRATGEHSGVVRTR